MDLATAAKAAACRVARPPAGGPLPLPLLLALLLGLAAHVATGEQLQSPV